VGNIMKYSFINSIELENKQVTCALPELANMCNDVSYHYIIVESSRRPGTTTTITTLPAIPDRQ